MTAVFAADAVARLSGTVGVAAVTAGPGLTNTVTAVKNAQMAESPLLLIGGAAATLLKVGRILDVFIISYVFIKKKRCLGSDHHVKTGHKMGLHPCILKYELFTMKREI